MALLTGVNGGAYVGTATGPDPGIFVTAASVIVAVQAVLNVLAFLNADKFSQLLGGTISAATTFTADVDINSGADLIIKNGCTFTTQATAIATFAGAAIFNGALTCNDPASFTDTVTVSVSLAVQSGATLVLQSGSTLSMQGRRRRRSRVQLSAINQSVGPADGECFELAVNTTGVQKVITLLSVTGQMAEDGELLEFIVPNQSGVTPGSTYRFDRESGVTVATFSMVSGGSTASLTAQFEFVGSAWRLGMNSGWDDSESIGVVPGAGA